MDNINSKSTDLNKLIKDVNSKSDVFLNILRVELKKYNPDKYKKIIELLTPLTQNYKYYKPEVQQSFKNMFNKIETNIIRSYNRDKDVKDPNALYSAYATYIINNINDFITQTNVTNNISQQKNYNPEGFEDSVNPNTEDNPITEETEESKQIRELFRDWLKQIADITGVDSEFNDRFKLAVIYSFLDMHINNPDKNKPYIENASKSIAKLRKLYTDDENGFANDLRNKISLITGGRNISREVIQKLYKQVMHNAGNGPFQLMENKK